MDLGKCCENQQWALSSRHWLDWPSTILLIVYGIINQFDQTTPLFYLLISHSPKQWQLQRLHFFWIGWWPFMSFRSYSLYLWAKKYYQIRAFLGDDVGGGGVLDCQSPVFYSLPGQGHNLLPCSSSTNLKQGTVYLN